MRRATALLSTAASTMALVVDPVYPGTAVARMNAARERVKALEPTRARATGRRSEKKLLFRGLKDLQSAVPGQGYTGHAFNDSNHCDATTMLGEVSHNLNEAATTASPRIAIGNRLGPGIEIASLPELGAGGSWSTCTNGCHLEPPQDVAHVQFRSRIAFKLVWCPRLIPLCSSTMTASCSRPARRRAACPTRASGRRSTGSCAEGKYATAAEKVGAEN